jgi:FAD/FMN-containing dehydrogenase
MGDQASPEYLIDMSHASAASSQASTCSVEPGSAEDVSNIVSHLYSTHKLLPTSISQLRILGSTRTPFGVKSGGHGMNPGFSSTNGVQIVMTRFNETKVNSTCGTVEIGAGLTWDQVYDALEPTGVNVAGGRVPGVGVAGLTLGGGEYFRSNRDPELRCI